VSSLLNDASFNWLPQRCGSQFFSDRVENMIDPKLFDSLYVKGMDVDIHLATKGDPAGIPLLLLPGITSYSLSFANLLSLVPDQYYALSMDMRGRGKSTRVPAGYRLEHYVADVLNVLNALVENPVRPFLVGHSMGARVAAAFAGRHSSLVSGIVLIDPPVNGPGQRPVYPNSLSMFLEQKAAVDQDEYARFRGFFPNFSEEQVEERFREYRNVSLEAIIESYQSLLREPFQIHFRTITCPTLLLAAELGDTIREQELKVLQSLNPAMKTIRVRNVGHMVYKEAPAETASNIIEFVQAHTS